MKIRALAFQTLESFLHNRLVVLVLILASCIVVLMLLPLWGMRAASAKGVPSMEAAVLEMVSGVMSFVSGLGSILAAWGAAEGLYGELKAGTVLAVMARPVKRWEFLTGKYLGVMMFMAGYILLMMAMSYTVVGVAGMKIHASPWELFFYPLVRYSIYAAMGMWLTTMVHPVVTMGLMLALTILTELTSPRSFAWRPSVAWLKTGLFYVLPSTELLTEDRFLSLRQAALKQSSWVEHALSLSYGLDCALILLLLAIWSFHYRTLQRD